MDVYLLHSESAAVLGHPRWQPPLPLYVNGSAHYTSRFLTGGGLIRYGNTIYIVTVEDLSALKWSLCHDSSRSHSSSHSQCQKVSRSIHHYNNQPPPAIALAGTLVHVSAGQGYSLVRMDPGFFAGDEELIAQVATPIETLGINIDEPRLMDFVQFSTASGEEVTGIVASAHTYCVKANGTRRKVDCLLVDTSSYVVAPEDCGVWVQRSVASDHPLLLGHVLGFSEEGSFGMLMLPFNRFKDDMCQAIRSKRFSLP